MPDHYAMCPALKTVGRQGLHPYNQLAFEMLDCMGGSLDGEIAREIAAHTGENILSVLRRLTMGRRAWENEAYRQGLIAAEKKQDGAAG